MVLIRFFILSFIKTIGYLIYPSRLKWINSGEGISRNFDDVSLLLILNHTSLAEFLYGVMLPYSYLWKIANRLVIPVADITLSKPFAKFFYPFISRRVISLTRKRDNSWQIFLEKINSESICIFMPEGRMKRLDGFDKLGKKMTVKKGVYDLLERFPQKKVAIVYGKGLHHILPPGERIPRIFKNISASIEICDIDYLTSLFSKEKDPAISLCKYLENKRDLYC